MMNMTLRCESSTSSPPTPPSPLPISFGPGNLRYSFSVSSTPSPPFSPPSSIHTSAENLPLLCKASVFSLDYQHPQVLESRSTCFKDLLEWVLQRCCSCCKGFRRIFLMPHNSSRIQCCCR
ncbi:hypothetical protein HN51_052303 [Arachis hypogaea]